MGPTLSFARDFKALILFLFIVIAIYTIGVPSTTKPRNNSPAHSTSTKQSAKHASWLLFTTATSRDFQRRLMIRMAWPSLFKDASTSRPYLYDHFFAIQSTDPSLIPTLEREHEIFGDILLLPMNDTEWNANHLKPFEVLKNVTRGPGWLGRGKYDYVAKIDQDSYIDPVRIWDKYLSNEVPERIMLSMPHEAFCTYPSPQGGFYAMSWDLAELIGDLYGNLTESEREKVTQEDCQVGKFPFDAREPFRFIGMDDNESFDVVIEEKEKPEKEMKFLAKDWSLEMKMWGELKAIRENVVFLHQMKKDEQWRYVMDLFDEKGWKNTRQRVAKGMGGGEAGNATGS